jgi:hypothetical protein
VAIAHSDASRAGERMLARPSLDSLLDASPWQQLRAIYAAMA